jgi:hypothetical protein
MAQYLPFIPQEVPDPYLYQPDYNFINQMMQRKQAQYEQGVSQVRSAYTSVLNAPLYAAENIPVRDNYVKSAQEQLKKLASADLSLPQNIQLAQSIFSPFWQDKYILKDYDLTQHYMSQRQKLASWRDSTDPKMRALYSPIVEQYLNNSMQKLQAAGRNDEDFSRLEKREAVPFTNVEEYLQDMAKKNADGEGGLKIVWDEASPDGAYLVSTTNGQRSLKKFATWAEGMLGSNFDQQFKITGIVQSENLEKSLRSNPAYANYSREQMNDLIANYAADNLEAGYKNRIGKIDSAISETTSLIKSYGNDVKDPNQIKNIQTLLKEVDDLTLLKQKINEEYKGFDTDVNNQRSNLVNRVKSDPSGYFSTLAKQTTINNWSTARAEVEKREIKKNEAFFAMQDDYREDKKFIFEQQKQADLNAYRQAVLSGKGAGKGKASVSFDENGNPITTFGPSLEGEDAGTGAQFMGLGTTNILDKGSAALVFNAGQARLVETANNNLFGPKGLVQVLKNTGLSTDDIMQVSSGLRRQLEQGDQFSWTEKEAMALAKLSGTPEFQKYWKDTKVNSLREGIISYAKDYFSKKRDQGIDFTPEEDQIFNSYVEADRASNEYMANEKNRKDLVKQHIISNEKEYQKVIKDTPDGKDLLTKQDIVDILNQRRIRLIDARSVSSNPETRVDNDKLAEAIFSGKVSKISLARMGKDDFENRIDIDGKTYAVLGDVAALESKIGSPDKFSSTLMKAYSAVVPKLQYFQNKVAQLGTVWNLNADDKKNDPQAFAIFQEALLPGNQINMYTLDADGKTKVIDDMQDREAIKTLLSGRENLSKYVGSYQYYTQGSTGNPSIVFGLKEMSSTNKDEIAGVDVSDLNKTRFVIELSPAAKGPNLNNLPRNSGNYIYEKLLQGESVKSDDFFNTFGISYEVVPNDNRNPDGGTVTINYPLKTLKKDPQTGVLSSTVEQKTETRDFSFTGENRMTPDEVMKMINDTITQLRAVNRQTQLQYNSSMNSSNVPAFNVAEELKKRGLK